MATRWRIVVEYHGANFVGWQVQPNGRSVQGVLEQDAWYYVQSRFRHEGLRAPVEVSREVVAISFSPAGRVANIERFGLEKGRAVVLSQRVTDSGIRGQTVLNQLLGNLGRIDTGDFFQSEL